VGRVLVESGALAPEDAPILAQYAQVAVQLDEVRAQINDNGGVAARLEQSERSKLWRLSALHRLERDLEQRLVRLAAHLGLSPGSRSRVKLATRPAPSDGDRFFR
jgi:P27 family predicted phage terminase small subunit